jgi:RimJ/RimL family protein N-acetyltransferase
MTSSSHETSIAVPDAKTRALSRWVPIRSLKQRHQAKMLAHLLALGEDDRYMRFGHHASDEQIEHYVKSLRFGHDQLLGIFDRRLQLIAVAHLALSTHMQDFETAEFGVSVLRHARGRGYGGRLFARSMVYARNSGITHLVVHSLSENAPMIRIAQRAGAQIERHGSESEALLRLPPPDFDSHLSEMLQDRAAVVDYHVKSRLKGWASFKQLGQKLQEFLRHWRGR